MANELGVTISALRFALKRLGAERLCSIEASSSGTIIHLSKSIDVGSEQDAAVSDPLLSLRRHSDKIEKALSVKQGSVHIYFEQFLEVQALAGKKWPSERDLVSHFTNWYTKNSGKGDLLKRVSSNAKAKEEMAYQEAHAAPKIDKEALREDWTKKIQQARTLAAQGNKKAEEWLNSRYTKLAIQRYGL